MTTLRFVLGLLWLVAVSGWLFFVPWVRLRRLGRIGERKRSSVDEYARWDVVFQIQQNCGGILLGLFFIWGSRMESYWLSMIAMYIIVIAASSIINTIRFYMSKNCREGKKA